MEIKTEEITSLLKQQLQEFQVDLDIAEVGEVIAVGDGVARVSGLENVMSSELVEFPNGVFGMALNLEEDNVGLVLFGESAKVKEGDLAKRTGKVVEVPIGDEMLKDTEGNNVKLDEFIKEWEDNDERPFHFDQWLEAIAKDNGWDPENLTQEQFLKVQKFFTTMPRLKHEVKVKNPKTKKESK